jgi:Tropinone reductase 1
MVATCMSRAERWNLAGATALVTGGSKGIGYTLRVLMNS